MYRQTHVKESSSKGNPYLDAMYATKLVYFSRNLESFNLNLQKMQCKWWRDARSYNFWTQTIFNFVIQQIINATLIHNYELTKITFIIVDVLRSKNAFSSY